VTSLQWTITPRSALTCRPLCLCAVHVLTLFFMQVMRHRSTDAVDCLCVLARPQVLVLLCNKHKSFTLSTLVHNCMPAK
jgi:hypothetical protein